MGSPTLDRCRQAMRPTQGSLTLARRLAMASLLGVTQAHRTTLPSNPMVRLLHDAFLAVEWAQLLVDIQVQIKN